MSHADMDREAQGPCRDKSENDHGTHVRLWSIINISLEHESKNRSDESDTPEDINIAVVLFELAIEKAEEVTSEDDDNRQPKV